MVVGAGWVLVVAGGFVLVEVAGADVVVVSMAVAVVLTGGSSPAPVQAVSVATMAISALRIVDQGTSAFLLCSHVARGSLRDRVVSCHMDENEIHDVDEDLSPEPPPPRAEEREGIPWGAAFLLVWAVLLIVFAVQNADDTTVRFLGWTWVMPVAMLVMITALATLVLTGLGSAFYRRRRRKRREMREALRSDD